MNLTTLLTQNRKRILKCWLELVFASYHEDSQAFLQTQKDHFNNPLGVTTTTAITALYDEIIRESSIDSDNITSCLDKIIRIRAVQDLSCEEALGFVFQLKHVVMEILDQDVATHSIQEYLNSFDAIIDALALRAFSVYTGIREELHRIRINEYKRTHARILERYDRLLDRTGSGLKAETNPKEADHQEYE